MFVCEDVKYFIKNLHDDRRTCRRWILTFALFHFQQIGSLIHRKYLITRVTHLINDFFLLFRYLCFGTLLKLVLWITSQMFGPVRSQLWSGRNFILIVTFLWLINGKRALSRHSVTLKAKLREFRWGLSCRVKVEALGWLAHCDKDLIMPAEILVSSFASVLSWTLPHNNF